MSTNNSNNEQPTEEALPVVAAEKPADMETDEGVSGDNPTATAAIDTTTSQKPKVFNSQEFMNFLTTQVDIANLFVETKDGQRISASFNGPSNGSSTTTSSAQVKPDDPPNRTNSATADNNITSNGHPSIFKSLDMLKSLESTGGTGGDSLLEQSTVSLEFFPSVSYSAGAAKVSPSPFGPDPFTSRDWAADYRNSHVEVSYSNCFDPNMNPDGDATKRKTNGSGNDNGNNSTDNGSSLPPKKRSAAPGNERSTDWNAMFKNALKPLVDAASVAQREQHHHAPEEVLTGMKNSGRGSFPTSSTKSTMNSQPTTAAMGVEQGHPLDPSKKKPNRRKPRKIIPENKEYVQFNNKDVLFGRGGRSNHHPGNKVYRDIVCQHQEHYKACDKNEKTKVAQGIVDHVNNVIGGRFLELDKGNNKWFLVPNVVARRKVGQALRENNTEEARAAKRAKYQGKINANIKSSSSNDNNNDSNDKKVPTGGNINFSAVSAQV